MTTEETETISASEFFEEIGHNEPLSFGELIRTWRECDEMTQVELAKKLGISKQLLSEYELGTKVPTLERGIKLAQDVGLFLPGAIQALIDAQLKKACVSGVYVEVKTMDKKAF